MKIIDPIEITKGNVISTNAQDELLPAWQVEGVQFPQNFGGQTVDYQGDTVAYHNDTKVYVYSRSMNQSRLVAEVVGVAPDQDLLLYDTSGNSTSASLNANGDTTTWRQVKLSPDESTLCLVAVTGLMVVVDLQDGSLLLSDGGVDSVAYSASGNYLARMGSRIVVWETTNWATIASSSFLYGIRSQVVFNAAETLCVAIAVSPNLPVSSRYRYYTLDISDSSLDFETLPSQATALISRPGVNEVTVAYVSSLETRTPGVASSDQRLTYVNQGAIAGIYSADGGTLYLLSLSLKTELVVVDRVGQTTQAITVNSFDVARAGQRADIGLSEGELAFTDVDHGFQFILESTLSAPSGNVNPQFESGERTIFQNRIYEAQQATQTRPDVGALESAWLDLGPVNSLRMFDGKIGSVTETEGDLEVVLQVEGIADGLALFGLQAGSVQLEILDSSDAVVFDTGSLSLIDNSAATDWYQYFFEPISYRQEFSFTKLPPYRNARIRVTLSSAGVPVKVGALILGSVRRIGDSQFGAQTGIDSFSRKERDVFGNFDIIKRGFSKTANLPVSLPSAQIAYVQQLLASLESKPVVYIGAESQRQTIIYGFYASFDMVLSGPRYSDYNLEIEGLTQ